MVNANKCCTNCSADMRFLGRQQIQLGRLSFLTGHLSNLLSGSLDVEIWECPDCGKLDFYNQDIYRQDSSDEEGHIAQTVCPNCGLEHDLDDPKCPACGAKNPYI